MTDQQKDSDIKSTIPMLNFDNALKDLSHTSHRIKDSFLRNNGPDPLELTKRMENLENKLELLKSECAEVEKYRLQLAVEVTQVLAENATEIQELGIITGQENTPSNSKHVEYLKLQLLRQNKCWTSLQKEPKDPYNNTKHENKSVIHK